MRQNDLQITANVFNIQSYSIHDGPGIRTTVFLKGCPLHCLWCANPESQKAFPQLMTYAAQCTGCGWCVKVCPHGAITMQPGNGGIATITDRTVCVNCGQCVDACPSDARELSGKEMKVAEVLERVLEDRLFLEESGGGMTISGGEPLMHPDFTEALCRTAQEAGLHTALESCCYAEPGVVKRVFQYVDYAMLDIKHMDPAEHQRLTGVSNQKILENLSFIYHELKVPFMISVPLIPGCNDSEENIAATARFIAEKLGSDVQVRLLPYHRLGESKNQSLGKEMNFSIKIPSAEQMNALKALMESFGLQTQIGG